MSVILIVMGVWLALSLLMRPLIRRQINTETDLALRRHEEYKKAASTWN
jgi:hypothetical protein